MKDAIRGDSQAFHGIVVRFLVEERVQRSRVGRDETSWILSCFRRRTRPETETGMKVPPAAIAFGTRLCQCWHFQPSEQEKRRRFLVRTAEPTLVKDDLFVLRHEIATI